MGAQVGERLCHEIVPVVELTAERRPQQRGGELLGGAALGGETAHFVGMYGVVPHGTP
ncbi:hypothetical protein ACFV2Q_29090 [Streptomyces sp. NPDC059650]|uniref:hypothetical protein n=1 Tax=Streptomyces sp. NPDC059650 TaxID=3346896 RepID=UPI003688F489